MYSLRKNFFWLALLIGSSTFFLLGCSSIPPAGVSPSEDKKTNEHSISPYVGQETRGIKSLSQADVEGLLAGHGTPFGGMAKLAELNGYPGPRHILDLASDLELTDIQKGKIEKVYQDMSVQAIELGQRIIEIEQGVDASFKDATITDEELREKIAESTKVYGELRFVHLVAHLSMMEILTSEQVEKYNILRGYTGETNPCENIPEGHNAKLWKLHNNCE